MQYRARRATPKEAADLVEGGEVDYSLSQTARFGEVLARAFREFEYWPQILEFHCGEKVFLPLVRITRRPRFLRCFEAMPLSLNGLPVVTGRTLNRNHLVTILESLRPDSLRLNAGATSASPWELSSASGLFQIVDSSSHVLGLTEGMDT